MERPTQSGQYGDLTAANGSIYTASQDEQLTAIDGATGAISWNRDIGQPIVGSTAEYAGLVFVSAVNGKIYATGAGKGKYLGTSPVIARTSSMADGARLWSSGSDEKSAAITRPTVQGSDIYVGTVDYTNRKG